MAAGAGGSRMLQEYLVSLGVQVDQRGMRKMQSALTMTKASVIGITGALAAMVTGIVKASASLTNTAQKYEDMARSGKKAVDVVARQEMALKAMGKTLDEVNKNDRLKRIYEDLQGIGSELSMPAAEEGRRALDGLGLEMSRMKMTAMYAFQWINHHFLNKLAGPMSNLRKQLEEMRKSVILNMPKITQVVGNGLAYFMQLMMAGVQGVKDLAGWIASLPTVVLQALGAFAGLWGVMKASPVFWILAGLTSLLMLLDDFQVYKAGGKSAFAGLWEGLEDGTFGDKLGEMLDEGVAKLEEKVASFASVGEQISAELASSILGHDFEGDGVLAGGFVNRLLSILGSVLRNEDYAKTFGNNLTAAGGLITGLLKAFASAMGTVEFGNIGADIGTFVTNFIKKVSEAIGKVASGEGTGGGGIFEGALKAAMSIATGLIDLLSGFFETTDAGEIVTAITKMLKTVLESMGNALATIDATGLGEKIGNLIGNAIKFSAEAAGKIIKEIIGIFDGESAVNDFIGAGMRIGMNILKGIVRGLGDVAYGLIFGQDALKQMQSNRATRDWLMENQVMGYDEDTGQYVDASVMAVHSATNPDKYEKLYAAGQTDDRRAFAGALLAARGLDYGGGQYDLANRSVYNPVIDESKGSAVQVALFQMLRSGLKAAIDGQDIEGVMRYTNEIGKYQSSYGKGWEGQEKAAAEAMRFFEDNPLNAPVELEMPSEADAAKAKEMIKRLIGEIEVDIKIKNEEAGQVGEGVDGVGPQVGNAAGGRYSRFTRTTVSEDGQTEYIIPMNKPERAKGLILQALAEMGTGARGILQSFGMSGDHGIGSAGISAGIESRLAMAGAYPSGGSSSMKANSDNVFNSNPTIYVYSNDPVIAGQTAAKETDRVLMKHIRGPYG